MSLSKQQSHHSLDGPRGGILGEAGQSETQEGDGLVDRYDAAEPFLADHDGCDGEISNGKVTSIYVGSLGDSRGINGQAVVRVYPPG